MASSSFSQDNGPEESISEIGFGAESSIASSSRPTTGGFFSPAQTAFRSHFSGPDDLGDSFLLIQNDPVTLTRAEVILKVEIF
jgi:hypothetical protein